MVFVFYDRFIGRKGKRFKTLTSGKYYGIFKSNVRSHVIRFNYNVSKRVRRVIAKNITYSRFFGLQ